MDFKNIPLSVQPAYTWLWNSGITRDGIFEQIEEMYESGIRAFYVIAEPEHFLPHRRRTHLLPEYLSEEYITLLIYAYETAKAKGIYMWLYNEGGFPSGMVCGKIREKHPELAKKIIEVKRIKYDKEMTVEFDDNVIAAFSGDKRIRNGDTVNKETEVVLYCHKADESNNLNTDIASKKNTSLFVEMTHEKLKSGFGQSMGTDLKYMFDDEASMGTWTDGYEVIFKEKYGYEIEDYLPLICKEKEPCQENEYKAISDYYMFCGELVRENYFIPMKEWLNKNNMLSVGHLDNDHKSSGAIINRYGNVLKTLRAFDIPGVDVIWEQISYPKNGKVCEDGMDFFPRMASSAAHLIGHSKCLSESLAVYGGHVDPELMRYVVNYQAVRGISLFNFMVISYDRKSAMVHQYRPNYVKENPSMNRLKEINDYTARVSYILQNSKPEIKTALYYPARSICACGTKGEYTSKTFEEMGEMLEKKGVCFDIIDEDVVINSEIDDTKLIYNGIVYEYVFAPECDFEDEKVMEKLKKTVAVVVPCIDRKSDFIQTRKVLFSDGDEGYFICNTGNETICETVGIASNKKGYFVELSSGDIYDLNQKRVGDIVECSIKLCRGEAVFLLFTDKKIEFQKLPEIIEVYELSEFKSYISREYKIDAKKNIVNSYFSNGQITYGLYEWPKEFSGEVTYICELANIAKGTYELDLGTVKNTAEVYVNDCLMGTSTFPPYRVRVNITEEKSILKIVVANTAANECARTDFFDAQDIKDVGPYHAKMSIAEKQIEGGGLFGPVLLKKIGYNQ